MNIRIKELWIKALRSGEFRQTKHDLKTDDGYCCLGVLCELYRIENGGEWVPRPKKTFKGDKKLHSYKLKHDHGNADRVLDYFIADWAGFKKFELNKRTLDELGKPAYVPMVNVSTGGKGYLLSEINDNGGSFDFIATLIEGNF